MTDWGRSNRADRFEFVSCDPFTLEELETIEVDQKRSSITWGYYTDNVYSGTITAADSNELLRNRLIRVRHVVTADGAEESQVLATMFVNATAGTARFGLRAVKANCYSTLWRFTQDVLISDFYRKAGYNVVQAIRDLVEGEGGKLRVLDGVNTQKTFGNAIWFELGTNRMNVINTIAGWIGCQVGCDGFGFVTIQPYVEPALRAVRYVFEAGANCTYLPGVSEEDNRADIVNRVVAYYTREKKDKDDPYPLTDRVVVSLPESNKFSYERCGRWKTKIIKLTKPCKSEELKSKARTYLSENSGEIRHFTIEHVSIPGLKVGDVVTYENDTDYAEPVNVKCMVTQIDMRSLTPGAKCTTKLKSIL